MLKGFISGLRTTVQGNIGDFLMSERKFGLIFGLAIAIFIAAVSYFGGKIPVPKNFVAGQAMVLNDENSN